MSKSAPTPAPASEPVLPVVEDLAPAPAAPAVVAPAPSAGVFETSETLAARGVDTDRLMNQEAGGDLMAMLGTTSPDLLPHEADRDFAPDAGRSDSNPFAAYLGRDTVPAQDEPGAPAPVADPALVADPTDAGLVEMARAMGMTVEELLGQPEAPATPAPAADAPTAPPAPAASPEVAALMETVRQLQAEVTALKMPAAPDPVAQTLAAQESQIAQQRAELEVAQRAAYEAQWEHLDDVDREAVVEASLQRDLLQFDSQASSALAEARQAAEQGVAARNQQEAAYQAASEQLVAANPTLGLEIAEGYRMVDFLADTHKAVTDAYGDAGPFDAYATAFEGAIKTAQTRAFRAGIAHAQKRQERGEVAPPVVSPRGGSTTPAPPRGGPEKLNLNSINFFAPQGKSTRR